MRAVVSSVSRDGLTTRKGDEGHYRRAGRRRGEHPSASLITRSSIWSEGGRSSASAAHSGRPRTPDHRSMRQEAADTEGKQDDHGTTADHRGACEADARQSVDGSAVASGRRRAVPISVSARFTAIRLAP
jgi:hypothetical protein